MRWSPHAQFPIDVKPSLEAGIDTSEKGFLCINPGTNELTFVVSHNFRLTPLEEGLCDTETHQVATPATVRQECTTMSRSVRQRQCWTTRNTRSRRQRQFFAKKRPD
ncbi:uncharacterized protein LOC114249175 [Bombyx mandarina]|uniref:Uncharacterized protein LOC114249175 n=1 Tax=Bombyx mandarina TaxID=7092 RepID=A0A6J2KDW6_BOMMA|nr:uncharacterized protein LOC114249175 [Bombyx mandarina]